MAEGRKVSMMSDRDFTRSHIHIWAGNDMPATILAKELVDNTIDVVSERKMPATEGTIYISPNHVKVMDNGSGISTEQDPDTKKTYLWLAIAKLFTSSNYEGTAETTGQNGLGAKASNFTSHKFAAMVFPSALRKPALGYQFTEGVLNGSDEAVEDLATANDPTAQQEGDFVSNPIPRKTAEEIYQPFYKSGYLVDVNWDRETKRPDFNGKLSAPAVVDSIDLDWIANYAKLRVGEINSGNIILKIFSDDSFSDDSLVSEFKWTKSQKLEGYEYIPSWFEHVRANNGVIVKSGDWNFAFFTKSPEVEFENGQGEKVVSRGIDPVVQGAPVRNQQVITTSIDVQDKRVQQKVPFTCHYSSDEAPKFYKDQTKATINLPYTKIGVAFEKSGEVYKYWHKKAEEIYIAEMIRSSEKSMFWPSIGKPEDSELIISEGYSAIMGIKSNRDPMTQACVALKGKILHTWRTDMKYAMKSDVIKSILNAIMYSNYKRIIIAADADPDGGHIASELVALFAQFTTLIQDGKVFILLTPYYYFKKGKDKILSSDLSECPAGYHAFTLKGLGSLTFTEIRKYITNKETRKLVRVDWDEHAEESLDLAFERGGSDWILP
jgi:hypothetical protein